MSTGVYLIIEEIRGNQQKKPRSHRKIEKQDRMVPSKPSEMFQREYDRSARIQSIELSVASRCLMRVSFFLWEKLGAWFGTNNHLLK